MEEVWEGGREEEKRGKGKGIEEGKERERDGSIQLRTWAHTHTHTRCLTVHTLICSILQSWTSHMSLPMASSEPLGEKQMELVSLAPLCTTCQGAGRG